MRPPAPTESHVHPDPEHDPGAKQKSAHHPDQAPPTATATPGSGSGSSPGSGPGPAYLGPNPSSPQQIHLRPNSRDLRRPGGLDGPRDRKRHVYAALLGCRGGLEAGCTWAVGWRYFLAGWLFTCKMGERWRLICSGFYRCLISGLGG